MHYLHNNALVTISSIVLLLGSYQSSTSYELFEYLRLVAYNELVENSYAYLVLEYSRL